VRQLSGGERSRAALAKLTVAGANVLVLDEPTNHLDIWACDSLEEAVKDYGGTCIVVSHDRYFLNRVADLLIVLDGNGGSEVVYGNYDTYELLRAAREQAAKAAPAVSREAKPSAGATTQSKPKRKRKYPFKKAADVEADIAACEAQIADLEAALLTPEVYRDGDAVKRTMADLEAAKARLPALYEHWEEAVELNG
jgi:ATP-binding cassette subfamily F protein 3